MTLLCARLLLIACTITCILGEFVHTHELTWAGGSENCVDRCPYRGTYACTNGTDAGDWAGGMKYYTDTQTDLSYVITQVNVSLQGSFACKEPAYITILLNSAPVGVIKTPSNMDDVCSNCSNCWASSSSPVLSSKQSNTGWLGYFYGHINEVVVVVDGDLRFCLSKVTLYLIFNPIDGSSSEHVSIDAPTWFWTLVIMGAVIIVVMAIVFFTLWRRSQGSGSYTMGYRPLSTHEYVDPSQLEDIKIDSDQLDVNEEIGRGSFGQVFKAKWRGTDVAVKRIPTNLMQEAETREFMKEAFILRQLRHPNVLQVLGASMNPACIVTEFMPRGNLFNIIHDKNVPLPWPRVRNIALDVCKGMSYLHGCTPPLIHRDLKPHNLLVDDNWRVKVCDFGLSKFVEKQSAMTACGTPAYAAPEVLRNSDYSTSADVYSFGVVLWELLTREALYPGMPPFQIIFTVGTQKSRPPMPPSIPLHLSALIEECWDEDPSERPDFMEITDRLLAMSE